MMPRMIQVRVSIVSMCISVLRQPRTTKRQQGAAEGNAITVLSAPDRVGAIKDISRAAFGCKTDERSLGQRGCARATKLSACAKLACGLGLPSVAICRPAKEQVERRV